MSTRQPLPPEELDRIARRDNRTYNVISAFFLMATCGVIAYVAYVWQNPFSPLNPLAPPTPLPLMVTATYTPTWTYTPSETFTPSPTPTASQTFTPEPTLTFTPVFIEGFSTPFGTPPGEAIDYPYEVPGGRVIYLTNPAGRGGCRWSSIAGSVMDAAGVAVEGYGVRIVGENVDATIATGSSPGFGPGGFELELGTQAIDADFIAQLLDPLGYPASPVYTVSVRSDCTQNIAALRFTER